MKTQHLLATLAIAGSALGTIGFVHAQAAGTSGDLRLQRTETPAATAPAMNSNTNNTTTAATPAAPMTSDVGTPRAPRADRN